MTHYIAFRGHDRVAEGDLHTVARALKLAGDEDEPILIFNCETSEPKEIDLRGSIADVLARLPQPAPVATADAAEPEEPRRGPGRPKLGVVAREITLLPRHWDWLATQPGGASVVIRKLIDEARKARATTDQIRKAREVTYRFATAMAGNMPHFEEAMRALFAGNAERFEATTQGWPGAIRDHTRRLAAPAFES
jgi:uncharacterized protein